MIPQFLNLLILFASLVIEGKVINVTDGDTISVLTKENITYKIRLENIDAPERKQAYYNNSKQYLIKQIKGKQVSCALSKKDKYGRWLGTVYYNKTNINLQLVSTGNAWAYLYNKNIDLQKAALKAQQLKLGLWSLPNPLAPWVFRKIRK